MTTPLAPPAYVYPALLLGVTDGDTVKLSVRLRRSQAAPRDLGFHVYYEDGWIVVHESMRLVGLNAAEHGTPAGDEATAFVKQWFAAAGDLTVSTVKDAQEKYGRFLARITSSNGHDLNNDLLVTGHAVVWDGKGTRPVPA